MKCDFEYLGEEGGQHRYRCRQCGNEQQFAKQVPRIARKCDVKGPERPSLLRRSMNFSKAAAAHALRGHPKASQEAIDYRFAICQECPSQLFDGEVCTHRDCGCKVSRKKVYLNKLAWADQACPAGHWPAIDTGPPLKVAILSPCFVFGGGVEQWAHSLMAYVSPEIDFIGVGVLTEEPAMGWELLWDKAGIDYILPLTSVSLGARACWRLANDCDVLIVWGIPSLEKWFSERPKKPIVFTNHGASDWTRDVLDEAAKWADHFVAVSEAAQTQKEGSILIQNGVDPQRCRFSPRLRPSARQTLGLPADALVVGQIGRLVEDKDVHAVARAVRSLGGDAWGLLVGRGPENYIEEAKRIAEGRLVHVPATGDIATPLAAMDCFLFSSLFEGFGLAVVEAWAAGVPTVSTRVGIIERHPDMVVEVPLRADGDVLAKAVRAAVDREGNMDRIHKARKLALEQYSARQMADRWRDFLLSIRPAVRTE